MDNGEHNNQMLPLNLCSSPYFLRDFKSLGSSDEDGRFQQSTNDFLGLPFLSRQGPSYCLPLSTPSMLIPNYRFQEKAPEEEPKPNFSYIGLIAKAILSTKDRRMVLSEIYEWIQCNYAYFRSRGPGWRNSIRHNLSLNDCFIKVGRSSNGKGHYWGIHPANVEDFRKGDFRRRRAQRKVRRALGLSCPGDADDSDSPPLSPNPLPAVPNQSNLPLSPFFPLRAIDNINNGELPSHDMFAALLSNLSGAGLIPPLNGSCFNRPDVPQLQPNIVEAPSSSSPGTASPTSTVGGNFSVASLLGS